MATDYELLEGWRGGDQRAGETLFERHFRALYRFFRNKGVDAIDDLVQQTFLGCVEGRDRLRGDASFRTYMFAVARNQLFRFWKQRGAARDDADFQTQSLCDLSPSASRVIARRAEQRALLEALRRIPLDYQIALELYYFEDMRGPEIAAVLDIPEPTVRSRLRRGGEQLRRQLEAIADSPEVLQSTLMNLDEWARGIRAQVEP